MRHSVIAAGLWSVLTTAIGAAWTISGDGFPFGRDNDPSAVLSPLGGLSPSAGAPAAAVLGAIGTLVAATLLAGPGRRFSTVLTGAARVLAAILILAVPDYRVLVIVAYTPLMLIALPLGLVTVADYLAAFTPPVLAQVFALAGGLAWTAVGLERSTLVRSRAQAVRWGRGATAVAVAIPLVYAATRWAWALGIPLGLSDEMMQFGRDTGLWIAGAGLATLAIAGAVLTLGLTMSWGERWPGWFPRVGGRPVPVAFAVVPAAVVAALVTTAGLMFIRLAVSGTFDEAFAPLAGVKDSWAALAPELLWPIWGPALALAALTYARRRSNG